MRHAPAPGRGHARRLEAPDEHFEAPFGQEAASNSRLGGLQFLLRFSSEVEKSLEDQVPPGPPGAGPHARCSAQVPLRSCSCVSAVFSGSCVCFFFFILVLL